MNGPREVVVAGCPRGRWSRTSTIKHAVVRLRPFENNTVVIFHSAHFKDVSYFCGYLLIANIFQERL
jgi:hypothetical protein